MRKTLVAVLALASVGLAGCVAVPAYDAPVAYGPPVAVYAPPPSVGISFGYTRYYGGHGWRHRGRWR